MATKKKPADDKPIRLGDLVAHRLAKPATVKGLKRIPSAILATGTATGHSHRLSPASEVSLYDEGDGKILARVTAKVKHLHQEHAVAMLEPGDYRIMLKRAYDADHGWRAVVD